MAEEVESVVEEPETDTTVEGMDVEDTPFDLDLPVIEIDAARYVEFVAHAKEAGFDSFVDLCAVDYFRRTPRYEVVVILRSHVAQRQIRVRVSVDGKRPELDSIVHVFPGANFYEREAYDLFGIVFSGHPDLTRILLPDEWEGHPLRKDYAVGSVPVQFKGSHKAS